MHHRQHFSKVVLFSAMGCILGGLHGSAAAKKPPESAAEPASVQTLLSLFAQSALLVEGTATAVDHEYTEALGPWTATTLTNVVVHFGDATAAPGSQIVIRQFGGPMPSGKIMYVWHQPEFEQGVRYLVFLRNTSWNLSPVTADQAFRLHAIGGKEMVLTTEGHPVVGMGMSGLRASPVTLLTVPDQSLPSVSGLIPAAGDLLPTNALHVGEFVAQVGAHMTAMRVKLAGEYFDEPAGKFKWSGSNDADPNPQPDAPPPNP